MRVNSRRKGARGEREAAKFLRSLGFAARRGVQYHGGPFSPDVVVVDLGNVHLEVKFGVHGLDLGTRLLGDACNQAITDAAAARAWAVLWKPPMKQWRMTYRCDCGGMGVWATVYDTEDIARILVALNGREDVLNVDRKERCPTREVMPMKT